MGQAGREAATPRQAGSSSADLLGRSDQALNMRGRRESDTEAQAE